MNFHDFSFSQSFIARIASTSGASVSKYISSQRIDHLNISIGKKKYNFELSRKIIKHFISERYSTKEKVQVFFNFKGGTGKTSICYQTSFQAALMGYKVLVIDCDPQGHLSYAYRVNNDSNTLYDIVVNNIEMDSSIQNVVTGLDIIPANLSMTRMELILTQQNSEDNVFCKLINDVKDKYDFIMIDTNPTISLLNYKITLASDVLNIICDTSPYSLKGLEILIDEIKNFSTSASKDINYRIIANKYEARTSVAQEVLGALRCDYKGYVIESIVRKCEDINISSKKCIPISAFCGSKSYALEDIIDLSYEVLLKKHENR